MISAEVDFTLSPEEWLAVLCVAHRYECHGMHARALHYLQDGFYALRKHGDLYGPPAESDSLVSEAAHILAAAEARAITASYLASGPLRDIVLRRMSLSAAELDLLSPQLTAQIALAREWKLWNTDGSGADDGTNYDYVYERHISEQIWPKPCVCSFNSEPA